MRQPTPLKLAIVAAGLTQRDVATRLGLSDSRMSMIVNGLRCDDELQASIAEIVGRPVGELWPDLHDSASNSTPGSSDAPSGRAAA